MDEKMMNGTVGSATDVKVYEPMGISRALQQEVTSLLHQIIVMNGKFTLAELGYLHMNTVTYVKDHVEVKVYFLSELATTKIAQPNGRPKITPSKMLEVFKNYLYVGNNLDAVTSFENITVPKYSIVKDELGRPAIQIKNGKKTEDDVEVLVLHCNFALTMAAINGVNLSDPQFKLEYETIGSKGSKVKSNAIITTGSSQEFPVRVTLTRTNPNYDSTYEGYDPDQAVPYLMAQVAKSREAKDNQKKLARKVSETADNLQKKAAAKSSAKFNKFM